MRTQGALVGTGLALAGLLLVGCAAGTEGAERDPGPYAPSASPRSDMDYLEPPADYAHVEGEGFTISAPAEFQQHRRTSSNGEPMLVLEHPSSMEAFPERVAVIRDVDPVSPAEEQSYALEVAMGLGLDTSTQSEGPGSQDEEPPVLRVALPAPEGESAFLVTWTNKMPTADGAVEVTHWQLIRQVSPDLILNVVAVSPSADFETSEVSKILRTFRTHSDA